MSNYLEPSVDLLTGYIAFRKYPGDATTINLDMSGSGLGAVVSSAVVKRGLVSTPGALTISALSYSTTTRILTFSCSGGVANEDYIVYITATSAVSGLNREIPIVIKVESRPDAL